MKGPELPGMQLVKHLGSGGFSDVFLYEQDQPRMKVAVKLLRAEGLDDAQRRQFAAEADAMGELAEHPYIVPVLSFGTAPDGRPYLVMRYYPPPDLGKRVATDQLSVAEALKTGIRLASAVETAHRAGIIHRDIKPENVLVSSFNVPGLTDFGIAGRGDRGESDDDHFGLSIPWSPPEVITGASNGSPTSDVYSLAATIWNFLVGRSPFSVPGDDSEHAMIRRILHSKPPATHRADVPGSLDRLLQQALAKDPGLRPQSALELARHLQRVEQEIRLDRTEIFVLETELPPVSPDVVPAVEPDEEADDGVTIRRAPRSVRAQAPVSPPAPEPTDPTTHRPAVPEPGGTTTDDTQRRPQRVRAIDTPTPTETGGQRRTNVVAGAIVAGLLLAAVGVGVALSMGDDGRGDASSASQTGATEVDDVVDGFDPVLAPEITAEATPDGQAVFRAKAEESSDVFQWQVKLPGEDYTLVEAAPRARKVRIDPGGPGEVCVKLVVRRDGQVSDPADQCVKVS